MTEFYSPREVITLQDSDQNIVTSLAQELGVSCVIAKILSLRGLVTYDMCKKYFRPDISHFHDPFLFKPMERAVNRILKAIKNNEKIVIYGDYDVDGITSTVLLVRVLRRLGANCDYYIPNRLTEGYGISLKGIDEIANQGGKLIISVDCGIKACKEVQHALKYSIDIIVSDHHEAHGDIPEAFAVLNPKIEGVLYPDKELAGVGVALKLCQAVAIASNSDDSLWLDYLDIVSLGTAADIVKLVGENRIIAKLGFELLEKTKNIGLQKLISFQGIEGKKISTSDVVFLLAPCINAAGRLGDPSRGVKLLLTEDEAEASLFARELVEINRERQALDKHVLDQACEWVLNNVDLQKEYVIVAGETDWHIGVIGIVASKLADKFCRPSFLFTIGKDGIAKGSGRSVRGLHLLDALSECSDLLTDFGGHSAAAGAKILSENIPKFRARFNEAVKSRIPMENLVPHVYVDAEVDIGRLTPKFFKILKQMEPFGPGNMRPVLFCRKLSNYYAPRIVGKNHLKMTVYKEGQVMDAIAFNFKDRIDDIKNSDNFSLAFSLDENEWNGKINLQMKVKGVEI